MATMVQKEKKVDTKYFNNIIKQNIKIFEKVS